MGAAPPRYLAAVSDLLSSGDLDPTRVYTVTVHHEADCPAWGLRGPCACAFDLTVRDEGDPSGRPGVVSVTHARKVHNVHNSGKVRKVRNVDHAETFPFSGGEVS